MRAIVDRTREGRERRRVVVRECTLLTMSIEKTVWRSTEG